MQFCRNFCTPKIGFLGVWWSKFFRPAPKRPQSPKKKFVVIPNSFLGCAGFLDSKIADFRPKSRKKISISLVAEPWLRFKWRFSKRLKNQRISLKHSCFFSACNDLHSCYLCGVNRKSCQLNLSVHEFIFLLFSSAALRYRTCIYVLDLLEVSSKLLIGFRIFISEELSN